MGGLVLLVAAGIGLIPAFIAKSKGRDFLRWWLFGTVAFIVALVAALIIEAEGPCPSCGAKAKASAEFCPACGIRLPKALARQVPIASASSSGMTPMQREVLRRRAERERSQKPL